MRNRLNAVRRRAALAMVAGLTLAGALLTPVSPAPPANASVPNITGCQVKATLNGVLTWHHFTRMQTPCVPAGTDNDRNIANELIRLVNGTPAGATIRGAFASLKDGLTMNALEAAHARGVALHLTLPDGENSTDFGPRFAAIGGVRCADASGGTSCNGTSASGTAHTKALTFSSTTDPDGVQHGSVTWIGSANPALGRGGVGGYNNAMTSYGDVGLFTGVNGVLTDMRTNANNGGWADYYNGTRGYVNGTSANVLASPELDTDFVAGRLSSWVANSSCEARVAQAVFRRVAVAQQLKRLATGGCQVYVIAEEYTQAVFDVLKSGPASLKFRQRHSIHDKSIVMQGDPGNGTQTYRVYTGSHNLNDNALHNNDEMFVVMQPETGSSHPVYDAYQAHFGVQGPWTVSTSCPQRAALQTTPGGCWVYR